MSAHLSLTFLQISDVHLGRPFGWLPPSRRETRRLELREVWRRAVDEAVELRADAILVPGDLFDGEEADAETVNRAIECVRRPGCPPVFIAPGNHDCYSRANTYYDNAKLSARRQATWPEHVTIFTSPEIAPVPLPGHPEVKIWGRCVHANVDSEERVLNGLPQLAADSAHILLLHGSRDGFLRPGKKLTAPFSDQELLATGFDYVALGHYHERAEIRDAQGRLRAAYSGSPAALARNETGAHEALFIRLELNLEGGAEGRMRKAEAVGVPVDSRRLLEVAVDVTGCGSREMARERVLTALDHAGALPSDLVYTKLAGRPRPGVDLSLRGEDFADRVWFLAADASAIRPGYDLETYRLGEPRTTEERFARSMLAEIEDESDPDRKALLESALYYGLDALKQGRVAPCYEWGLD